MSACILKPVWMRVIPSVLCDIARAGSMSRLARDAKVTRAELNKAISPAGNKKEAMQIYVRH